jgi:hypothetical protein
MTTDLDKIDREALTRAMSIAMRDPARAGQLTEMLTERPWERVAVFAAYCCQIESLRLRPFDEAPCHGYLREGDGSITRHPKAGRMADKLIELGLSVYEPEPATALKRKSAAR